MLIQWHKSIAFLGAIFWTALGMLAIGSIRLGTIAWVINLGMGFLFVATGYFLYRRAKNFSRFYETITPDAQNNPHLQRFLRLDLLFVLGAAFLSGLLLLAAISRVFGEGYAIFG
jgi:hypothetical protein